MGINRIAKGRYRVTVRIRKNGKIVHRRQTIDGTLEEAKHLQQVIKQEIREGFVPESSLTILKTFGDVLSIYRDKRDMKSPSNSHRCTRLERELGDIDLNAFPDRFEQYVKMYRINPTAKTGKPPANATVNRMVEIVRASFNLAVDLGILPHNPITKARFPKLKETPRDVVLSDIDKRNLLNIVEQEASYLSAIIRFALQVPCRKSELVNMKREDLDLIHNAIRVRNGTTKNEQGTWKPIPPDMVEYFRSIPAECEWLFYRKTEKGYVTLGDFKKAWYSCLEKAGIRNFRFHDTRHMSATALLDNGTPEQVVMAVAGWKTNMLKTYYHRDGKKSLELVRFTRDCEPSVNPLKVKAI